MPITEGGRFTPNDKIVSPGVFTRENDLSGVTQGVADIGAVVVAPFAKGPGFAPTLVTNTADLESKFGVADGVYYGPYTAMEYLKQKGFVTVCRVGALTGYNQKHPVLIYAEKGEWNRATDAGAVNSASSFLQPFSASSWWQNNSGDIFTYTSGSTGLSGSGYGGFGITPTYGASVAATTSTSGYTVVGNTLVYSGSVTSGSVSASNSVYTKTPTTSIGGITIPAGLCNYTASTSGGAGYYIATVTGSLKVSGSIALTLAANAATNTTLSPTSSNGSQYFNGQLVTGTINQTLVDDFVGTFYSASYAITYPSSGITASTFTFYTASVNNESDLNGYYNIINNSISASVAAGIFSGNFPTSFQLTYPYAEAGKNNEINEYFFNNVAASASAFISASFTVDNSGGCAYPVLRVKGVLSGSFGAYNGTFTSNGSGPSLDSCGNYQTGSGMVRLIATLADTQFGGFNTTTLDAPGFAGSYIVSGSGISGSNYVSQNYNLYLSSSNGFGYANYEFSLDPGSPKYIKNVFGMNASVGDPNKYVVGQKKEAAYLYNVFEDGIAEVMSNPSDWILRAASPVDLSPAGLIFSGASQEPLKFTDANSYNPVNGDSIYSLTHATTPWITSQAVAGVDSSSYRFKLFQIATLADGTNTNTSYKIEISNVKLAGTVPGSDWGSFTLSVRDFNDTENRPKYLENFQNLSLDPNSPNFIARRIGDRYNFITFAGKIVEFGTFANLSKYIRIVMTENNYPESAVPYGFEAMYVPMGGTVEANIVHTAKYSKASTSTTSPGKFASGFVFGETLTADSEIVGLYPTGSSGNLWYNDNLQYLAPIPAGATVGRNVGFYLDSETTNGGVGVSTFISSSTGGTNNNGVPAVLTANESTYVKMRKFVVGFQGGFDGQSPAIPINAGSDISAGNTQGLNCATITSAGSVAYHQCLAALSNADEFDINLLVMPGIFHSQHSYVAQLGIDLCEQRGDCFYIMDNVVFPASNQSTGLIDAAINDVSTIDSNYVGTYYPWIKILDTNLNKIVSVPPSVIMPSIYASSDNAAAEWFAPAGLNRGGIPQAVQTLDRLTWAERDTLYAGRVNPIAAFPGQGICVWGQKTLQVQHSALDRINVRRLLINLKKFIASTSKYLVFEQNTTDTRNRFLSVVNPYLESVQQRSGLYAYKVVCDATNNTADIIDNNILYGQIYLQPAKTAEYIVLDFNILPTGAVFPGA